MKEKTTQTEMKETSIETPSQDEPIQETVSETDKLIQENAELRDKYLRNVAEFDNFRRRTSKERLELMQTAGKEIITSLLDVLDDCDRAEKQWQQSGNDIAAHEGTLLVFNKLRNLMQQKGLKPMESIGTDFDIEKHEAISEFETEESMKGKVIDELVKGYYLNEKLIRFAKVVVGK